MRREIRRFEATTEGGQAYIIIEYKAVVKSGHLLSKEKGEPAEIDGKLSSYETTEGYAVNRNDDGTFEIVNLGVTVTVT